MPVNTLHSLDALLLTVRDTESKRLAQEAVAAYQAGACRAAILSIWVAVCADIISKIKELATGGDAAARAEVTKLEGWISRSELRSLQQFENGLIELARDQFEMFLSHEATDLLRLREDRHLCAHPAFVSDDALFAPTPELVRAHIAHAILHLLSHPPVQGKQLVARFDRDLLGGSLPSSMEDIETAFRENYLVRAKTGAVITLAKALAKALVGSEASNYAGKERQITRSLAAIGRISPAIFEEHLPPLLENLGRELSDELVLVLCRYVEPEPRVWDWIGSAGRTRVLSKIGNAKLPELAPVFIARHVEVLGSNLLSKVKLDYSEHLQSLVASAPCKAFVGEALSLYSQSRSYATAEKRGTELLLPHAPYLTVADIGELNRIIRENPFDQILVAGGTPEILNQLFEKTRALLPDSAPHWASIAQYIVGYSRHCSERYSELLAKLRASGVEVPTTPETEAGARDVGNPNNTQQ